MISMLYVLLSYQPFPILVVRQEFGSYCTNYWSLLNFYYPVPIETQLNVLVHGYQINTQTTQKLCMYTVLNPIKILLIFYISENDFQPKDFCI